MENQEITETKPKFRAFNSKKFPLVAFLLIFSGIAGYIILRGNAQSFKVPTGADQLVLEYAKADNDAAQTSYVPEQQTVDFRLYGDGLAVCGNGLGSKDANYYRSTKLTSDEIKKLTESFVSKGLLDLPEVISKDDNYVVGLTDTIKFNTTDGLATIRYVNQPKNPKPNAYKYVEQKLENFCKKVTQPYVGAGLAVVTKPKKTKDVPRGTESTTAKELDVTSAEVDAKRVVSNNVGKDPQVQNLKNKNRLSKKLKFSLNGKEYWASVYQNLPTYKLPKERPAKTSLLNKATGKAYAASTTPIKMMVFCATNACGGGDLTAWWAPAIKGFYEKQVGKTYNQSQTGIYRGSYTKEYYMGCPHDPNDLLKYGCGTPLQNALYNIKAELIAKGLYHDTLYDFKLGWETGPNRVNCGETIIYRKKFASVSVVDTSNTYTGTCSGNGYDIHIMAHELGHAFGLSHNNGVGLMAPGGGCDWSDCSLQYLEAVYLSNSPYFYTERHYQTVAGYHNSTDPRKYTGVIGASRSGTLIGAGSVPSLNSGIDFGGFDIIRGVSLDYLNHGYLVDANGGLHPFNGAPAPNSSVNFGGTDIARDVKIYTNNSRGWVLDGYGALHPFNGAPSAHISAYWNGWDIAKKFAIKYNGSNGFVLDGYGGLHSFWTGSTKKLDIQARGGPYWLGVDIARSVTVNPAGTQGYVLDGYGALHPFGSSVKNLTTGSSYTVAAPPKVSNGPYWSGWDVARDVFVTDWTTKVPKGYIIDWLGGIHPFGG